MLNNKELHNRGSNVPTLSILAPYLLWWFFFGIPEAFNFHGETILGLDIMAPMTGPFECKSDVSFELPWSYWLIGTFVVPWALLRWRVVGLVVVIALNLWALYDDLTEPLSEYFCSPGLVHAIKRADDPSQGRVHVTIFFLLALAIAFTAAYRYWQARRGVREAD